MIDFISISWYPLVIKRNNILPPDEKGKRKKIIPGGTVQSAFEVPQIHKANFSRRYRPKY